MGWGCGAVRCGAVRCGCHEGVWGWRMHSACACVGVAECHAMPCHAMQHTCKLNEAAICKKATHKWKSECFQLHTCKCCCQSEITPHRRACADCVPAYAVRGQQVLQQILSQVSLSSITLRPGHVPTHMQQTRSFSLSYARTFARSEGGTAARTDARYVCMYVCMYVCITSVPSAGHTAQHSTVHTHTCTVGERHHTHDACETRHDVRGCGCGCGRGK